MSVEWDQLLTVDCAKVAELFVRHAEHSDTKVQIRGYTIPFTGTQQKYNDLMVLLRQQLLMYVFPDQERPPDIDWALGRDKFGDIDPKSDGKLGEMLLYVFVEAFLKTPLMAYKLKDLGNPNDQVKGADGVFVGEYDGQPALLIGESKIHQSVPSAIKSTMESLQRFHVNAAPYTNELMIARKYPAERGLSGEVLEAALSLMTRKEGILVHPVFVSYDWEEIAAASRDATTAQDAEAAIHAQIGDELRDLASQITSQRTPFPRPFQVHLDFFFLPVEDCLGLRNHFYEMLHGHPYESTAVKTAVKRVKRDLKETKKTPTKRKAARSRGKT